MLSAFVLKKQYLIEVRLLPISCQTGGDCDRSDGIDRLVPIDGPLCYRRNWRQTSYSTTPAATAMFSDSAVPAMGIRRLRSPAASRFSGRPVPSLPKRIASGCGMGVSHSAPEPDPDVTATATPPSLHHRMNSSAVATAATGTPNTAPIDAFTATGSNGSVPWPDRMTPAAPAASAVLMIVPRLPGLATSCSATNTESGRTSSSASVLARFRTIAAKP